MCFPLVSKPQNTFSCWASSLLSRASYRRFSSILYLTIMARRVNKPNTIQTYLGLRSSLILNPTYQRGDVWDKTRKQLLIDSILREYDIPKIYLRKVSKSPYRTEVVDGQQRTRAIIEFTENVFPLPAAAAPVDGEEVAGLYFSDFSEMLLERFNLYDLTVVEYEDATDEEIREMFLRLQNGVELNGQEKRNAMMGSIRDCVQALGDPPFFQSTRLSDTRAAYDSLAAQCLRTVIMEGPCRVQNNDLNAMYETHRDLKASSPEVQKTSATFDYLRQAFPVRHDSLSGATVVTLFMGTLHLVQNYVLPDPSEYKTWFEQFETERHAEIAKDEDADEDWATYHAKLQGGTASKDAVKFRYEHMLRHALLYFGNLTRKDKVRDFSSAQRMAIYYRDAGRCQLKLVCKGEKVEFDNYHCDHVQPWSAGGPTTVDNGQVACSACNLAKGAAN